MTDVAARSTPAPAAAGSRGRLRALWNGAVAALGAVVGLVPHLLHHAGLVAGAGLVTGAKGNAALGALGLLASLPLLRRLHRRSGSWQAPALALVAFAAMFSLSAFVIGPVITGSADVPNGTQPAVELTHSDQHHPA